MAKPRERKTGFDDDEDDDEGLGAELDQMDLDDLDGEGAARLKYAKKLVSSKR